MNNIPWLEKYRPLSIDDVLCEECVMQSFKQMITNRELQNIILTGPPGVGKTSIIKCIAKELYGPYYDDYVLEINASDDRGIKIENTINKFCSTIIIYNKRDIGKYSSHKLIILDETDNITQKAQKLINNTMEVYQHKVRFIFTCNISSNIIPSIQSKCIFLIFSKLKDSFIKKRIEYICKSENINYKEDGLDFISNVSNGDMRVAINILNHTNTVYNDIFVENIKQIYDKPYPEKLKEIIKFCIKKNFVDAIKKVMIIKDEGYCSKDITMAMFNILKSSFCDDIQEDIRINMLKIIGNCVFKISKLIDTDLQLYVCICKLVEDTVFVY